MRLLNANEIECKVATVKPNGISLLLYKTARTDMTLLDEEYGVMNWQVEYKEIKGNMYCGISVYNKEIGQWITKWNCGVESAFGDKEKGEASDAMKRSGFCFGIGRELYSSPFIWIQNGKGCSVDNGKCYDTFDVKEIGYNNNREIDRLVIVNRKTGEIVFSFGNVAKKQVNTTTKATKITDKAVEKTNDLVEKKVNEKANNIDLDSNELDETLLVDCSVLGIKLENYATYIKKDVENLTNQDLINAIQMKKTRNAQKENS